MYKAIAAAMFVGCLTLLTACSKSEPPPPAAPASTDAPPVAAAPADVNPPISAELAARLVRDHSPVIGPVGAPVTVVEFLDPACEGCAAFSPVVKQIQLLYPSEVRVVVRFAAFHQGSDEAVRLLVAAQQQGKFEPVLDALFERQQEWASHHAPDVAQAWEIAKANGLNIPRARRDAKAPSADSVLKIDGEDVIALQVNRTPTFFVNGRAMSTFGPNQLLDLVKQEVGKTSASGAN
jgi:protein-disulfide isomerase